MAIDNNDFTHEFQIYSSDLNAGTMGTGEFMLFDNNINALTIKDIANIKIGGGSNGRVLATDGDGNLRWISAAAATGGVSSYNDLTDLPALFSGNYNDLTNKPTLFTANQSLNTGNSVSFNRLTVTGATGIEGGEIQLAKAPSSSLAGDVIIDIYDNKIRFFESGGTSRGFYLDLSTGSNNTSSNIMSDSFSGSYNDLTNKPTVATSAYIGTTLVAFNRSSGALTLAGVSIDGNAATVSNGVYTTGTYVNPAWITSLAYSKLTDAPSLATVATSGSYADLTSKPSLATVATSGSYSDLTNRPTIFSGAYADLTGKPTLFDGAYLSLTGLPNLAAVATSGSYNDLSNKPTIPSLTGYATEAWVNSQGFGSGSFTGSYNDLTNKPNLFSGNYNDLTNKPSIPSVPTDVSAFNNDSGYITSSALSGYATESWVTSQGYGSGSGSGAQGPAGADGADGQDGASAYEVAVANGFIGNQSAWLASLVGATGQNGTNGNDGAQGEPGAQGPAGNDGTPGQGVPTGGTAGQILAKIDSSDYSTEWVTPTGGPDLGSFTIDNNVLDVGSGIDIYIETSEDGGSGESRLVLKPDDDNGGTNPTRIEGSYGVGIWSNTTDSGNEKKWLFGTDGGLTLPGDFYIGPGEGSLGITSPDAVAIIANQGTTDQLWLFGTDGDLVLPAGKTIRDTSGVDLLADATSAQLGYFNELSHPGDNNRVQGEAVAMDSDGNSYVSYSYYNDNENKDFGGVAKFSVTGEKLWSVDISSQNSNAEYIEICSLEYITLTSAILMAFGSYYDNNTNKDVAVMFYINPADGSVGTQLLDAEITSDQGMELKDGVIGFDNSSNPFAVIVGSTYEQKLTKTLTPLAGSTTDKLYFSWADVNAADVQNGAQLIYNVGGYYGFYMNAAEVTAMPAGASGYGLSLTISSTQSGSYVITRVNGWGGEIYGWSTPVTLTVLGNQLGGVNGVNDMTFDFDKSVFNDNSNNIDAAVSNIQGTPVSDVYCTGFNGKDWSTEIGTPTTFDYNLNNQAFIARLGNDQWSKNLGTNSNDRMNSVVVDSSGNTYAAGYAWTGSRGSLVVKYNVSGVEQWAKYIDPSNNTGNELTSIDLLASGDVITVDEEGTVTKLDKDDGSIIWQVTIDDNISWDANFRGTATPDGDYIITNYEDDDYTMYVMRVSGTDGSSVWTKRVTRTLGGNNGEIYPEDDFDAQYIDCNDTYFTIGATTEPYSGDRTGLVFSLPIDGLNVDGTYGEYVVSSETMSWTTESTTAITATVAESPTNIQYNSVSPTSTSITITVNQTSIGGSATLTTNEITNTSPSGSTYSVSVATNGVISMTTSRGGLEFGALPEPGGPSHFHIMRPASENGSGGTDLYFGDDYNYMLQRPAQYGSAPGYGVEIGANDRDGGDQHVWRFGTDGGLTFPYNYYIGPGEGSLGITSPYAVAIVADQGTTNQLWLFGTDGKLQLPSGGDIVDSTGTSVLGGGTTLPADASGYLVNDGTGALSWAAGDGTFSGDYNDLTNKPTIPADVSDLTDTTNLLFSGSYNDLSNTPALFDGDYTNLTNTPALFDGDYNSLANTPSLFSGDYDDLTSKPTLFDGAYSSLTGTPALFSGSYTDLTSKPTLFDGAYSSLTGTPALFSGSYTDLTSKPTLFSGSYTDLTSKPALFSGSYTDLTDKPTIPTSFSSLVNGSFTASLDSNGELSLPTNAYTEAVIKELSATALVLFAQSTGGNIKLLAGATSAGSAKQWLFNGTDGKLTLPGNLQVDGGKIILNSAGNAYVESVDYGVNSANSAVNIFGGPYQKIKLRAGFGTEATWTFDTDGDLTAPRNIILNNPVTTVTTSVTGTVADSNGNPFTFRILKSANPQLITPFADPNFVLKWTGGDAGSLAAAAQAPGGQGPSSLVSDDGTYWNFNSWFGLGGNRPNSGTVFTVEYGVVDSDTTISTTDTNLIIEADAKQYKFGTDGNITLPAGGDIVDSNNNSVIKIEAPFAIKTAGFDAFAGGRYGVNTTSNAVTATLPPSPATGDAIWFADAGGAYDTNNLIINPGSNTIMSASGTMTVSTNDQSFGVFYNGTTWRVY